VFLLCSGEDGVDERVAYDMRMDDDDDDDDDESLGADVTNDMVRNDVMRTDDVDERHHGDSLTSSSCHVDFTASPPSPRRPVVAAGLSSSRGGCRTVSPRPACRATASSPPPACRSASVDLAASAAH